MEAKKSVRGLFLCCKQVMVEAWIRVTEVEKECIHLGYFLKVDPIRVADGLDWEGRGHEGHRGITDDP